MTPWNIVEVPGPPADLGQGWPGSWAVEGYSRIRHDIEVDTWGISDRWAPTPVLMWFLAESPWRRTTLFVAVREGGTHAADDVLGVAEVTLPQEEDGDAVGYYGVAVAPDARGRGIGTALAEAAESRLAAEGRTVLVAMTSHSPESEPGPGVVTAPTGSGRIDLTDRAASFAIGRGLRLEQVSRASLLDVPADTGQAGRLLRDAAEHAGPDYRVHSWNRTVPEEHHAALGVLWARMSTDAPSGGLDLPEQEWDAARVAEHLERQARANQQWFITAAEHVPTGTLAAFTALTVPEPDVEFGFQQDTLVLSEHRGRRLGMLVKAANLLELVRLRPKVRRVHTDNAEENGHMLAINERLGFRRVGVFATWQQRPGA